MEEEEICAMECVTGVRGREEVQWLVWRWWFWASGV